MYIANRLTAGYPAGIESDIPRRAARIEPVTARRLSAILSIRRRKTRSGETERPAQHLPASAPLFLRMVV
jgi:hypothetical protein